MQIGDHHKQLYSKKKNGIILFAQAPGSRRRTTKGIEDDDEIKSK